MSAAVGVPESFVARKAAGQAVKKVRNHKHGHNIFSINHGYVKGRLISYLPPLECECCERGEKSNSVGRRTLFLYLYGSNTKVTSQSPAFKELLK